MRRARQRPSGPTSWPRAVHGVRDGRGPLPCVAWRSTAAPLTSRVTASEQTGGSSRTALDGSRSSVSPWAASGDEALPGDGCARFALSAGAAAASQRAGTPAFVMPRVMLWWRDLWWWDPDVLAVLRAGRSHRRCRTARVHPSRECRARAHSWWPDTGPSLGWYEPSATPSVRGAAGSSAERPDGLWITAWTLVAGVLCIMLGAVPCDASTSERSARLPSEGAARAAGRRRLASQWDAYSADRATPAKRSRSARSALPRHDPALLGAAVTNEGPVAAHIAGTAARHLIRASA